MSGVVEELPSQHHAGCIHGDDGLQSLEEVEMEINDVNGTGGAGGAGGAGAAGGAALTLAAVKVNMGRKMMASLASGILVQTAARTVMMAPD